MRIPRVFPRAVFPAILWFSWSSPPVFGQEVIYVRPGACGANNGLSWKSAYGDLQDALAVAQADDEIWVATGVYTPDRGTGDRSATFQLVSGVAMYGGFAGWETKRDQRNPTENETILSGDLADNDSPRDCAEHSNCCREHMGVGCDDPACEALVCELRAGCCDPLGPPTSWDWSCVERADGKCCDLGSWNACENSYAVVTASGTVPSTLLDGFTVTGAYAENASEPGAIGAGLIAYTGSPTVANCVIRGNVSYGIYARDSSDLTLANCTLLDNLWYGVYITASDPTVTECTFLGNGVGMSATGHPTLTNCTFRENADMGLVISGEASVTDCSFIANGASGMYLVGGPHVVTGCTFFANSWGGVLNSASNATFIDCMFVGNLGPWGLYNAFASARLTNCAFLGNVGSGIANGGGTVNLTNCILSGNHGVGGGVGAAISMWSGGTGTLTNCTLAGNYSADGIKLDGASATITNSVLWGNSNRRRSGESAQIFLYRGATVDINNSLVEGWTGDLGGVGNFADNPLFVNADGPDRIPGTEDDNLRLLPDSPCLDQGDNAALPADTYDLDGDGDTGEAIPFDLDGDPRVVDGFVDIGAYEGSTQAILTSDDDVLIAEGCTAAFTVTLAMDPLGPVEIAVERVSGDRDITILSDSTLAFDSHNFFVPQTVTLAAEQDPGFANGNAIVELTGPSMARAVVTAIEVDDDPVPARVFVDESAVGLDTGTTWADAFRELRDALAAAADRPGVSEIWVAAGTYTPAPPGGDRIATFRLLSGVGLYGGFAGGETSQSQRDWRGNMTILSGDLNSDDKTEFRNNDENSTTVVTASDTDATAILDGFVVMGGNHTAVGGSGDGGAIDSLNGSPTVRNCVFRSNWGWYGGALSMRGGTPTVDNCVFVGNAAHFYGGGVWDRTDEMTLTNCMFTGNSAGYAGGAVSGSGWNTTLRNCTFVHNTAGHEGGGAITVGSNTTVSNCIIWGNRDYWGTEEQSQVWAPNINFSIVQGWTGKLGGVGNFDDDPLFVDADGPDKTPGTADDNLRLMPDSPAIDAGDPDFVPDPGTTDLDTHPRVLCGQVDMGAYEFGIGDLDCDRIVDLMDFSAWAACMTGPDNGPYTEGCEAFDFDADLEFDIDLKDFAAFQNALPDE